MMVFDYEYSEESRKTSVSTDASGISGLAKGVVYPKNYSEIQKYIKLANKITIRGGGSGVVGGALPQNSLVIDLSKMNNILELDRVRKTVVVEAGVLLSELNNHLERYGLEFPINHSAPHIATVGGMLASNATGSRSFKYKRTGEWVEELEVIKSDGELVKIRRLDMNNFVGMEGITGIIFKAKLKLIEIPVRSLKIYKTESLRKIIDITKQIKILSRVSMAQMLSKELANDLGMERKYHLFVEFESEEGEFKGEDYREKMSVFSRVYPLLASRGYVKVEDPKVFLDRIDSLIEYFELNKIPYFAEIGRGVLHPLFKANEDERVRSLLEFVRKARGQISGSHGVGVVKKEFLDSTEKNLILRIKNRHDPAFKLNSGVLIDKEYTQVRSRLLDDEVIGEESQEDDEDEDLKKDLLIKYGEASEYEDDEVDGGDEGFDEEGEDEEIDDGEGGKVINGDYGSEDEVDESEEDEETDDEEEDEVEDDDVEDDEEDSDEDEEKLSYVSYGDVKLVEIDEEGEDEEKEYSEDDDESESEDEDDVGDDEGTEDEDDFDEEDEKVKLGDDPVIKIKNADYVVNGGGYADDVEVDDSESYEEKTVLTNEEVEQLLREEKEAKPEVKEKKQINESSKVDVNDHDYLSQVNVARGFDKETLDRIEKRLNEGLTLKKEGLEVTPEEEDKIKRLMWGGFKKEGEDGN